MMDSAASHFGRGLYSPKVASHIAKIKYQNFQAWSKANLLHPIFKISKGKRLENVYTYYDLLLIRLIKRLRDRKFSTKTIKTALDAIYALSGKDPYAWARSTIVVYNKIIVVKIPDKPDWPIAASKGTQKVEVVYFPELIEELENELVPPQFQYVEVDPNIMGGTPVIRGTRIPTKIIHELVQENVNPSEAYPDLTEDQIKNANDYEEFLVAV
jgi:uncharacterized protein (DUF433 family)